MKNRNLVGDVDILKLIDYRHFRTIDSTECVGSLSEYLIHIEMKDEFRQSLDFITPFHGNLYAYAFVTDTFDEILDKYGFTKDGLAVDLVDWDEAFVISFEQKKKEIQLYCNKDAVRLILERCVRIPSQRISNTNKKRR